MFLFSLNLFFFFIKFIIYIYVLNIDFFRKNFKNLIISLLIYDIATDLAYFMIDSNEEDRPWWFNIFMGSSLFLYLIKIHALKSFCEFFSKNKESSKKIIFFSFLLALPRFIFYFYFSAKNNFIKNIIDNSYRYRLEYYLTQFAISIYPIIILFNPIKDLIDKINKKEIPLFLEKIIFITLYFGIIFRLFLDLIQTTTLRNIYYFLFENELFFSYSHYATKITCILTTIYFFIIYYFSKKIALLSKLSFNKNKFINSIDENEKQELIIDIKNIEKSIKKEFSIKDIIDDSIKETISKILNVSSDFIYIEYKENFYENFLDKKSKFFSIINKNEKIKNYLMQNSLILFDEIDSYLYINEEESDPEIFLLKNELLNNNISAIFSWGNNELIEGIIVIEELKLFLSKKNYNEESIKKIIFITEQLRILQNNFNQRQNIDILNFKSKTLEDFGNYITSVHENILKNINSVLYKIKNHILEIKKNKIKWLDYKKPEYYQLIENLIERNFLIEENKFNDQLIYRDKENTFILNKIENKKEKGLTILVLFFPFSFVDFNKHKFILIFTEIGKKINEILPGLENNICEYKNKLINIINDSRPSIIIFDLLKIKYLINLYNNLNNFDFKIYSYLDFKNESCIKNIFNNFFIKENLEKKFVLIIENIFKLDLNLQKKILEEYIKKENEIKSKNLKLILIISDIQDLTYLNFNIINISMIYDIYNFNIKETINNEKMYFIKKICKSILLLDLSEDQIEEIYEKINFKNEYNWTFYGLIDFIKDYFRDYKEENIISIDSSIQKAINLGKNSLKNDELMFSLLKIYKNNYSKIAKTLGVHKSSVSRFFKNYKEELNK